MASVAAEYFLWSLDVAELVIGFIFRSVTLLSTISFEIIRYTTTLLFSYGQYILASLAFLGFMLCDQAFPVVFDVISHSVYFIEETCVYLVNALADFGVTLWTSSAMVASRDYLLEAVQTGSEALRRFVVDQPLLCGKIILVFVWTVLFITHRKQLHERIKIAKAAAARKMHAGKNEVLRRVRRIKYFVVWPFAMILQIPAMIKAALVLLLMQMQKPFIKLKNLTVRKISLDDPNASSPSVEKLRAEVRQLRTSLEEERESKLCVICQHNIRQIVFMPCRHFAVCEECMGLLPLNILSRKVCPVCRSQIRETHKIYI